MDAKSLKLLIDTGVDRMSRSMTEKGIIRDLIVEYLAVPSSQADIIVGREGRDADKLIAGVARWKKKASDFDLVTGRAEQIVVLSEDLQIHQDSWANRAADMLSRSLLMDRQVAFETFKGTDAFVKEPTFWTERVARRLARIVIDGPRLAAFVLAETADGRIAATTRPDGRVGLPGGKLDAGETAVEAAIREAEEEGWRITVPEEDPIHVQDIEGFRCAWFLGNDPVLLGDYAEKGRITPFAAEHAELMVSKLGNENAIPKMLALKEEGVTAEP